MRIWRVEKPMAVTVALVVRSTRASPAVPGGHRGREITGPSREGEKKGEGRAT